MVSRRGFSRQAVSVLAVLSARPADWHHGYAIAKETGLKSGTLYPILIRLSDGGLIEARWEEEHPAGRPRRHLYQLTAKGAAAAAVALADLPRGSRVPPRVGLAILRQSRQVGP
ncbi:MAG TPA: PadR family transcriptional regulator [Streptosporangiaceae bacterium]|nr:PadR family transcriptional regulator [Streptosporangiaceae bacterium]